MPTSTTKPKNFTFYTVASGQSATLTGNSSTLYGDNDLLVSSGKNNVLIVGLGSSTLVGSSQRGSFTTLNGNGSSSMVGGLGNDYFSLTGARDGLHDTISGVAGGIDTVASAINTINLQQDTTLFGPGLANVANLVFTGSTGGATLTGGSLPGSLIGSKTFGNSLTAGTATQTLVGGSGDDLLAGNGRSVLIGNGGNDTYVINQAGDTVVQTVKGGTIQTTLSSFDLTNSALNGKGVNNITGVVISDNGTLTSGVVTLIGNSLGDTIIGAQNTRNYLVAGPVTQQTGSSLVGGSQNDTLIGNLYSTLSGGAGTNTYIIPGSLNRQADRIVDAGTGGTVIGQPQRNANFYYDLSWVASASTTTLTSSLGGSPTVVPGNGHVTHLNYTGQGNATLIGNTLSSNTDTLSPDIIIGGSGANTLVAGTAGASLMGGAGGNLFIDSLSGAPVTMVGANGSDTYVVGNSLDQITEPLSGGFGGIDQVTTDLPQFSLSSANVGGGSSVERLVYAPFGTLPSSAVSFVGNTLNNTIDASRSTGATIDGGGGYDTLVGSTSGANLFLVTNPQNLGPSFVIRGGASRADTLSLTTPSNSLTDAAFGAAGKNGVASYVSNVQNLVLSSSSAATLGVAAQTTGISRVYLGQGPDTLNMQGYGTLRAITPTIDATSNTSYGDLIVGSNQLGSAILFSSAQAIAQSTLQGGIGSDTLAVTSPLTLNDSFQSSDSGLDVLSLTSGSLQGNSITLGANASQSGIATVVTGSGPDTINAAGFTSRGIVIDAGADATSADFLAGSATANSAFLFSSQTALSSSTIVGGSGRDTVAISTPLTGFFDAFASADASLDVLSLGSGAANSVSLGANAQSAGISYVYTGSGADTVDASSYSTRAVTLDASADLSSPNFYLAGNPSVGSAFVISTPSLLSASTISGGIGSDTLRVSTASTLWDSVFGGSISGVDVLSLQGAGSVVTLDSNAASRGIGTVLGGAGSVSIYQNYNAASSIGDTLPSSFGAGSGPAFFAIGGQVLLANDTITGSVSTLGADTLQLTAPSQRPIYDSRFANVSSVEVLKLAIPSTLYAGSNASQAGISTVSGNSLGGDFVNVSGYTAPVTLDLTADTLASLSDTIVTGSQGSVILVPKLSQISTNSIVGGTGSDTLVLQQALGSPVQDAFLGNGMSGVDAISVSGGLILGSLAASSGISAVYSGSLNSTLAHTSLDANPTKLVGNAGNDSLFVSSVSQLLLDTISGGGGINTLTVGIPGGSTLTNSLPDSVFANVSLASGSLSAGVLSLVGNSSATVAGPNGTTLTAGAAVTLGSMAASAGIGTVFGGDSNDTITQGASNSRALSLVGGNGSNLFILNGSQLSTDSLLGGTGSGRANIQLTSPATLGDGVFANDRALRTLILSPSLSGSSSVAIGSLASAAGISSVVAGPNADTINASGATQPVTLDARNVTTATPYYLGGSSVTGSTFLLSGSSALGQGSLRGGSGIDTLAVLSSSTLSDSLLGRITSMDVLSLSGSSAVTLGGTASLAGIRRVVLSDSLPGSTVIGNSSVTQLGSYNQALTLQGGAGNDLFSIANGTLMGADSIIGGGGTDSLQLGAYSVIPDSLFAKTQGISVLQLNRSTVIGGSSVTLGPSAGTAGISTIVTGSGPDIINAALDTRVVTFDARANTSAPLQLTAPSLGAAFVFGSTLGFSASSLRGNSLGGIDTLQFTSPVTLSDSLFSHDTLVSVLQLTSSSSATLGPVAAAAGIKSVVLGTGSDTVNATGDSLSVTLDARLATNTLTGDFLRGSSLTGSAFLLPNSQILGISTITGGNGADSLILSSSTTLADSLFANTALQPGIPSTVGDVLSLAGASAVTLDNYAATSGIKRVVLGDSLAGSTLTYNSTITQNTGDTLPLTLSGGAGNDLLVLANSSLLAGATTLPAESISGGGGSDTIALSSPATLADALFGRISSIGTLQLSQGQLSGSAVTLGANSTLAGIRTVVTGSGRDSVNGGALTSAVTLDARADSLVGQYLKGGSLSGSSFLFTSASPFAASTVIGGTGTDTIAFSNSVTLADSAFANDANSSLDVLSLAGSSSVTLGSMGAPVTPASAAQLAGITTVFLSDSLPGDTIVYNSSFAQGSNDTLAVTAVGGAGNDLFLIANGTILAADSLNGGAGINTLSLATASTLTDANFSRLTSIQALQLATSGANSVTVASNASSPTLTGLSTIIGGTGNDTVNAGGFTSTLVIDERLNSGAASSLIGGSVGTRFLFGGASGLSALATLRGGAGTDTLQLTAPSTLSDSAFTKAASIEVLQLTDSSLAGSSAILGSLAAAAGIRSVVAGTGADTINASGDSLSMTLDARALTGTLSGDLLKGSSVTGSAFLLTGATALGVSSITGGSGVDSLILNASSVIQDSLFANVAMQPSLPSTVGDILSLAGASSVTLDSYAAASGIKVVLLGDSLVGSTLAYNSTLTQSANDTLPLTLVGGVGNDLIQLANGSLLAGASTLPAESITGGGGADTLQILAASTIGDSLFARVSNMAAGVLALANGSQVTLDSAALSSGFRTVLLGDSPSGGSTLTQAANDTLPLTVIAGSGNDLITIASTALLATDSIKGGVGIDTLALSGDASFGDSLFGRVSSIDVLSLSGTSAVTLGSSAQATGIMSVFGGSGSDTIFQSPSSSAAMTLIGGASSSNLFVLSSTAQLVADSLLGGYTTLAGGGGTTTLLGDTLAIAAQNEAIVDTMFSKASNIGSLSLTGSSTAVLGMGAQSAGISTIYGGADTSLVSASAMTAPVTINNSSDINASSLAGGSASDFLIGGTGNDTLKGWSSLTDNAVDTLAGGSFGSNLFVLGNASGDAYMNGGNADFALITDFLQGRDSLQLKNFGNGAADYTVIQSSGQVGSQNYTTQLFSGQELIADLNVVSGDPTQILNNARFL